MNNREKIQIKDADNKLKEICQNGLKRLFGNKPPKAVKNRLTHELKVVAKNKHSEYYLIASMLASEAERLNHVIFFRGTITSSLIAYAGGFSKVNPMGSEFGGVNLPFETTREEFEGTEPSLDIQCSVAFIMFAQSYLLRALPEYRCISYPLNAAEGIRSVRLLFAKPEDLPTEELLNKEDFDLRDYPDFMYFNDYFRITMIGDSQMELVRYNTYFSDEPFGFSEKNSDKLVPKLWKYVKEHDDSINGYKSLRVRNYEELITVLSLAHSTRAWEGLAKKMVKEGKLSLANMIGSRDDLFTYLVEHGVNNREAFEIMNQVRKGRARRLTEKQIAIMKDHGVEEWVLDFCFNVKYLFPRAHNAQIIRKYAFCLREPEEFVSREHSNHKVLSSSFLG